MLEFQWTFVDTVVSAWSLGNLTIDGEHARVTTSPRQSMMLFPTFVSLLDELVAFLRPSAVAGRARGCKLNGIDSSFSLTFTRTANARFIVEAEGRQIATVTEEELVHSVWAGIQGVLRSVRSCAGDNAEDLENAERAFAAAFGMDETTGSSV